MKSMLGGQRLLLELSDELLCYALLQHVPAHIQQCGAERIQSYHSRKRFIK